MPPPKPGSRAAHGLGVPGGRHAQVDEARPGDLGARDPLARARGRRELLGDLARRAAAAAWRAAARATSRSRRARVGRALEHGLEPRRAEAPGGLDQRRGQQGEGSGIAIEHSHGCPPAAASAVVGLVAQDRERAVELLEHDHARELVRQRALAEAPGQVGLGQQLSSSPCGPPSTKAVRCGAAPRARARTRRSASRRAAARCGRARRPRRRRSAARCARARAASPRAARARACPPRAARAARTCSRARAAPRTRPRLRRAGRARGRRR